MYSKVIWPCIANRNEHAGQKTMQASTAHQTICRKEGKINIRWSTKRQGKKNDGNTKNENKVHDAYENTRKCGELKLYFSPSAGG